MHTSAWSNYEKGEDINQNDLIGIPSEQIIK